MYREFFGLRENPFHITPDPRFIYFSKKHLEAFSMLLYGIEHRKGFVEITGEVGAGKTTLCRTLMEEIRGRFKTALIFNPNLSENQLLAAIVEDFGIVPRGRNKKDYFDSLNKFLIEEGKLGATAVLIIDEAQNLSARALEQIRLLSNLETDRDKLLQIVLVGQPELRDTLRSPELIQLRQRIAIRYHLTPLDREETERYILHRLKVAGASEPIFSSDAFDVVYQYAQGIPRLINVVCDKALLAGYVQEQRDITSALVEQAINEVEGALV